MTIALAHAASIACFLGPKVRDITAQPAGLGGQRSKIQGLKARHIPCGQDVSGFQPFNASAREMSLERRLAEAEATIESLRAEAAARAGGRKTAPAAALVSREGVVAEAGALDGALRSLSVEQRIAVKSEMLRAGLMG